MGRSGLALALAFWAGVAFAGDAGDYLAETPFVLGEPKPAVENADEEWRIYVYPAVFEPADDAEEEAPGAAERTVFTVRPAAYGRETEQFVAEVEYQVGTPVAARFVEREIQVETVPAHKEGATLRDRKITVEVIPEHEEAFWMPSTFKMEQRQFEILPERWIYRKKEGADGGSVEDFEIVTQPAQTVAVNVKVLDRPGRVESRRNPARVVTLEGMELVKDGAGPRELPAVFELVGVAELQAPSRVDLRTVPAKMASVTRMTVLKEAALEQEREGAPPAVQWQQTRRKLKTPERVVWRKYRKAAEAAP